MHLFIKSILIKNNGVGKKKKEIKSLCSAI